MPHRQGRSFAAAAFLLLACVAHGVSEETTTLESYAARARTAVKEMGGKLQDQLKSALAAGGAVSAISVCKTVAPQIAAAQSGATGFTVRRTALKVRNSANAPDDLERKVLEDFAARVATGTDPSSLEHIERVTSGGSSTVRYFKAIPMAKEPCLACHGTDLKADVRDAIAKLYPSDQATGFKAGDLRGMFSVTMPASD